MKNRQTIAKAVESLKRYGFVGEDDCVVRWKSGPHGTLVEIDEVLSAINTGRNESVRASLAQMSAEERRKALEPYVREIGRIGIDCIACGRQMVHIVLHDHVPLGECPFCRHKNPIGA